MKIGTPITPALGNVHSNFDVPEPCCFHVRNPYRTGG